VGVKSVFLSKAILMLIVYMIHTDPGYSSCRSDEKIEVTTTKETCLRFHCILTAKNVATMFLVLT
jgi:hypothetical protein